MAPFTYMNISLMAVDDLVIDYGAGTDGGDLIYLSDASQSWHATSFLYDLLEGRPSGVILRFDTGNNQLAVLDPVRIAHVRTSAFDLLDSSSRLYREENAPTDGTSFYLGIGAPRLDKNDIFDDRPLHFPNGLELTDDRKALLIADTANKRIIKHWIRGPRQGDSDLWAWTPSFPDNIRRGYQRDRETYWVVGCGEDTSDKMFDMLAWLANWPRVRKFLLKNIYLTGWVIEMFGTHLMDSVKIKDMGYGLKTGATMCSSSCMGLMALQYNQHGDIIRSIHSREFPNDLAYYSQVNELINAKTQEHVLYLSSPAYDYVTKLTLPTDSFDVAVPPHTLPQLFGNLLER